MHGVARIGVAIFILSLAATLLLATVSAHADSPVTDSFDTYNSAGWSDLAPWALVTPVPETDPTQCHQGRCVKLRTDNTAFGMQLQGEPVSAGGFSFYYRAEKYVSTGPFAVGLCMHTPCFENPYFLTTVSFPHDDPYGFPHDDTFHRLRFFWTPGTTTPDLLFRYGFDDHTLFPWEDSGTTTFTPSALAFLDNSVPQGGVWLDELSANTDPAPSLPLLPTYCTPGTDSSCYDNVLFLPGIEASRLYENVSGSERKLWEPSSDQDALALMMNTDGSSQNPVYTRDVIDNAYAPLKGNVYQSFIADMNALVSAGTINAWEPIAYDWRLQLDQLLAKGVWSGGNISYLTATDTPYIMQELKHLAAGSKTGKITIVAHSNGGLVAKALMLALGSDAAKYVDKIVFVAVPQVGTPQAIASLLSGYGAAFPSDQFKKVDAPTSREVADTFPGLYNLLPSAAYFSSVLTPVVWISTSTLPQWASAYGSAIATGDILDAFLTATDRPLPAFNDLKNLTTLSDAFVAQAVAAHQKLDAWTPPQGVRLIQIAGWGIPTTISSLHYARGFVDGATTTTATPDFVLDGDGTVVTPSALWVSASSGAEDYWIDLADYNSLFNRVRNLHFKIDHGTMFEVNPVRQLLGEIITNNVTVLPSDISYTQPISADGKRLIFSLHSPLSLNLYDVQGNHTGVSTTTGEIDEQIPGTYYTEFAGVKYVFTDESVPVCIVMNGYDTGTFTFHADELQGGTVVASTTFKDIPATPQTLASASVQSTLSTLSPIQVDEHGDGSLVYTLTPKPDATVTLDTTPPAIVLALSGTRGTPGWYTSAVRATLTTIDSESGVASLTYALDGATTSTTSARAVVPISGEGSHMLSYFAGDIAGNTAIATTSVISIDTTLPEVRLGFSTSTAMLSVNGVDATSLVTITTASSTMRIADQAGNALSLTLAQEVQKANYAALVMPSFSYTNGSTTNATTALRYFWTQDKKGNYTLFIAGIRTPTERLISLYMPLTNKTYVVASTAPDDSADLPLLSALLLLRNRLQTFNGLEVPSVSVKQGKVVVNY